MEQVLPVGATHLSAGAGLRQVEGKVVGGRRGSLQEKKNKEHCSEWRRKEQERRRWKQEQRRGALKCGRMSAGSPVKFSK